MVLDSTILRIPDTEESFFTGKTIFCGFSGGADSTVLLLLIRDAAERFHFPFYAVHFEHGFRGRESLDDAEACRLFCEKYGIVFRQYSLNVPENKKPGESDESAARRLRMESWGKITGDTSGAVIALGHNADDVVENLFLRFLRGANTSGLTALRIHSIVNGLSFYRPLLAFTRKQIEAALNEKKISWRTDSTNLESVYRRNFLRNNVLPMLRKEFSYSMEGMYHSCENLAEDATFIESEMEKVFPELARKPAMWQTLPKALLCRALRRFLSEKFSEDFIPDRALIERFSELLKKEQPGSRIPITGKPDFFLTCSKEYGPAIICNQKLSPVLWDWRKNPEIRFGPWLLHAEMTKAFPKIHDHFSAVFPASALPETLLIRSRESGDSMIPFSHKTPVTVKKLLSNAPSYGTSRNEYPLMCDGKNILWIPGVKRSDFLYAENNGKNVLFTASRKGNIKQNGAPGRT